ncbi:hypothetical protein BOX15_Mlig018145g1 [Macrostomum lignano]|uniref:Uncharacterized protein n=2 Tax=Macrostomum lignano TaxID=282301 RepID=A0A267FBR3_9PLAT|nr:hypothetical protein BOX15_Mlig018145g1 [Macrostomum lignano]
MQAAKQLIGTRQKLLSSRLLSLPSSSIGSSRAYDVKHYEAKNEPALEYTQGSKERKDVEAALSKFASDGTIKIPICIGDREIHLDGAKRQVAPFDHKRTLATFDYAPPALIQEAIDNCLEARERWEATPWEERAKVMLRAADMLAGPMRANIVAATMLGQAKTVYQAEIDAAAELIDFLRFNVGNMAKLAQYQPISTKTAENTMVYRGMEGFWAAVTPFNFTAIGGNLAASPAFAGNSTVWKPTDSALLSNYLAYKVLREAGLPPGVVNFVPADGPQFGAEITKRPELAGVNFTGSVPTFRSIWSGVAANLANYRTFPRLIGECGGKNFHFVHPSADLEQVANSTIRSAYEYSGQKCSACSRLYVPASMWPKLRDRLLELRASLKFGSPLDIGSTFSSAVIDDKAFRRVSGYASELPKSDSANLQLLGGGKCDDSVGYFVEPTIIETRDPRHRIMQEEIFGPVLAVYAYPDNQVDEALNLVDSTSPYALTGAVFSTDEEFVKLASRRLRQATGNFYINVQSTGSVVGQQPFGGARQSGTNDKAGGPHYLLKFLSPMAIKRATKPVAGHLPAHLIR